VAADPGGFNLTRTMEDDTLSYNSNLVTIPEGAWILKLMEGTEPIYMQIADWLENEILSGRVSPDEKIYSQYKLSEIFGINPATALKGLHLLVEKGIVYKKRGLGMFVASDALHIVKKERRGQVMKEQVRALVAEAKRLEITCEELLEAIEKEMKKGGETA